MTITRRVFTRAVVALAAAPGVGRAAATDWTDHFGFGLIPLDSAESFDAWRSVWPAGAGRWLDAFAAAYGGTSPPQALSAERSEAALDAIAGLAGFDDFIDGLYWEAFSRDPILELVYTGGAIWDGRADPDYIR